MVLMVNSDERFWALAQLEWEYGTTEGIADEFTGAVGKFGPFTFIILNKEQDGYRGVFDFNRYFWTSLPIEALRFDE
jgi:hypothetical protein